MYGPAEPVPPPPGYVGPPLPPPPPERHGYEGRFAGGLAWNLGFPVGSVHDFTSKVSAAGFELMFQYWLLSNVAIGAGVDWQTYVDTRPRTTYPIENGALTATAYNATQTGALRAHGRFYFLDEGTVLPYAGVNVGYGWSTLQTSIADILIYDNQDSIALGADVGAAFAFSPKSPLVFVAGRYTMMPSIEFLNLVEDFQSITIQIGLLSP
jgi:hypothetical protein